MDIKHVQKNADAGAGNTVQLSDRNIGHLSVSRGDDQPFAGGDHPLRIAEKPEEKSSQQDREQHKNGRVRQPADQGCHEQHSQSIVDSVSNHALSIIAITPRCNVKVLGKTVYPADSWQGIYLITME